VHLGSAICASSRRQTGKKLQSGGKIQVGGALRSPITSDSKGTQRNEKKESEWTASRLTCQENKIRMGCFPHPFEHHSKGVGIEKKSGKTRKHGQQRLSSTFVIGSGGVFEGAVRLFRGTVSIGGDRMSRVANKAHGIRWGAFGGTWKAIR